MSPRSIGSTGSAASARAIRERQAGAPYGFTEAEREAWARRVWSGFEDAVRALALGPSMGMFPSSEIAERVERLRAVYTEQAANPQRSVESQQRFDSQSRQARLGYTPGVVRRQTFTSRTGGRGSRHRGIATGNRIIEATGSASGAHQIRDRRIGGAAQVESTIKRYREDNLERARAMYERLTDTIAEAAGLGLMPPGWANQLPLIWKALFEGSLAMTDEQGENIARMERSARLGYTPGGTSDRGPRRVTGAAGISRRQTGLGILR